PRLRVFRRELNKERFTTHNTASSSPASVCAVKKIRQAKTQRQTKHLMVPVIHTIFTGKRMSATRLMMKECDSIQPFITVTILITHFGTDNKWFMETAMANCSKALRDVLMSLVMN